MSRDANYVKLINAKQWKLLRLEKLKANPLCEECQRKEVITLATEVHHITPVESVTQIEVMRHLMYDMTNLMSVCHQCHSDIHKEMFSHSKENVKKSNNNKTQRFLDKFL